MRRFISRMLVAAPVWVMLSSSAAAMCMWFVPPSRQFEPATNMRALVVRNDDSTRMVVQPEFSGNATDFALVMPFPSQPELSEAPETLFDDLEDLTNPELDFNDQVMFASAESTTAGVSRDGVVVVERRDVGDYSSVTLAADSSQALSDWLNDNGYEITDEKLETISQYVSENGYFVALKVNLSKAKLDDSGNLEGKLNPIEFSFESDKVMLPLRLMSGDGSLVTLTVYTLADDLMYIPGAEIQFSKKVTSTDLKETASLEPFDPWKKWLVRNVVQLDTTEITADLEFLSTKDTVIVVPEEQPVIINPDLLLAETGVIVASNGDIKYTVEPSNSTEAQEDNTSTVTWTMVIALSVSNVILLILLVNKKEQSRKS